MQKCTTKKKIDPLCSAPDTQHDLPFFQDPLRKDIFYSRNENKDAHLRGLQQSAKTYNNA